MLLVFFVSLIVALVVSAACSIAESVLLSLSTAQIADINVKNPKIAAIWENFKRDVNKPITAILTLNTAAHTIGASFAGFSFAQLTGNRWVGWFSLTFTFLMLQFTEILPKTLGVRFNRRLAMIIARPLLWLTVAGRPIFFLFQTLNSPFEPDEYSSPASIGYLQELKLLTSFARKRRQIDAEQERIILATLKLSMTSAYDVRVPFDETSVLYDDMTILQALEVANSDSHTRFPVCRASDRACVCGYVNIKELISRQFWNTSEQRVTTSESTLLTSFVHRIERFNINARASDVLNELVKKHEHIALVVDGDHVEGILTLEDLVEELVGEIEDEFDRLPDTLMRKRDYLIVGGGASIFKVAAAVLETFGDEAQDFFDQTAGSAPNVHFSDWFEDALGESVTRNCRLVTGELLIVVRRARRGQVFDAYIYRNTPERRANSESMSDAETPVFLKGVVGARK